MSRYPNSGTSRSQNSLLMTCQFSLIFSHLRLGKSTSLWYCEVGVPLDLISGQIANALKKSQKARKLTNVSRCRPLNRLVVFLTGFSSAAMHSRVGQPILSSFFSTTMQGSATKSYPMSPTHAGSGQGTTQHECETTHEAASLARQNQMSSRLITSVTLKMLYEQYRREIVATTLRWEYYLYQINHNQQISQLIEWYL